MSLVLDYLLGRQETMVDTLKKLVDLDSPSGEPSAVNNVGDLLAQAFNALDAGVERLRQTAYGHHLRVSWGDGDGQILLLGHMDTVWPVGESQQRPFRVVDDEETGNPIATGPGVFDMKGGLVVGLFAITALHNLGKRPAQRLVFLFNSDEEVGSPTSRAFIEQEAQRSDAVLVLEPSREEALVTWRKGVGRFELEAHGLASHSGAAHHRGISAIEELAHQVLLLEAMTDYDQGTTVNVGQVRGGSEVNVRPASAWAGIDLRVTSADQAQRATKAILSLQPVNPRVDLRVTGGINRPPWETSSGGQVLFEEARRVGAALGLELWPAGTGGGSDGNFTAALGIPTLDGLGIVGDGAHALDEWADVSSLPVRAALLAELLLEMGG